jgi:hypothetical protein
VTSTTIKGCDLALHLDRHVDNGEEIDEEDSSLSALFYIDDKILPVSEHPWYKNLVYYLQNQKYPNNLDTHQIRRHCLEFPMYIIIRYFLFRRSTDGVLLRCVNNEDAHKLFQ